MERLKCAATPRMEGGRLVWCEGDVFTFRIKIRLSSMGEPIPDHTGYTYAAEFFDKSGKEILAITENGDDTTTFAIAFDSETTSLFPRGRYFYDIHVLCPDGSRITCGNDLPALVV